MPDRVFIKERPYIGLMFHLRKQSTNWVLTICDLNYDPDDLRFCRYLHAFDISTSEEAKKVVKWRRSMWYTVREWERFMDRRGCYYRLLNTDELSNPDWEV